MTLERPMFPPRDSSRRGFLAMTAGGAVAATIPTAAAIAPAMAGMHPDAELIELGARFEPLVDQYYAVRAIWARAMTRSHSEHDRKFGEPRDRDYQDTPEIRAGWEEACERNGLDDACSAGEPMRWRRSAGTLTSPQKPDSPAGFLESLRGHRAALRGRDQAAVTYPILTDERLTQKRWLEEKHLTI